MYNRPRRRWGGPGAARRSQHNILSQNLNGGRTQASIRNAVNSDYPFEVAATAIILAAILVPAGLNRLWQVREARFQSDTVMVHYACDFAVSPPLRSLRGLATMAQFQESWPRWRRNGTG
jgi:hypothetical protein